MLSQITSYEQYVDGNIDKAALLAVREKVAAEVEKLNNQAQNTSWTTGPAAMANTTSGYLLSSWAITLVDKIDEVWGVSFR